ncbi:dihydrofolate reductase [Microbulbifer sp. TYP-18]|uniref:dihydrofolate reductase n=1 Tax=Microbulbifer sp. TYP-18 TaxID=3230024 RepID=UPI0034C6C8DB
MTAAIAIIAAVARNRAIGIGNGLPWRLSGDLKFFKQVTMGKPLVMGRKTYDSIGRPLPGRRNIVVSRDPDWSAPGVEPVPSLEQALELAQGAAEASGVGEVMVIGGAEVYRQLLPLATRLYLTEVEAEVAGDAFFPPLGEGWKEVTRSCYPASKVDEYRYCLVQYDRLK